MLRQARNELTLQVRITGLSPLLIKDGRKEMHLTGKEYPAMVFQSRLTPEEVMRAVDRKTLPTLRPGMFVPGSSLRGAWRSHLEKTLRSLDEVPKVCDPFTGVGGAADDPVAAEEARRPDAACSRRLHDRAEDASLHASSLHAYRESCPVCKLFGNTEQAGRIAFSEGKVVDGKPDMIDNNSISRQTGAAISPFKSLVLLEAGIDAEIQVRNFELWQLGLMAHLFDDLRDGRVRLGSGKSKGWGRVKATATGIKQTYFGLGDPFGDGKLKGVAEMTDNDLAEGYGMRRGNAPDLPAHTREGGSLWRHTVSIGDIDGFWNVCRPLFDEGTWNAFPELKVQEAVA